VLYNIRSIPTLILFNGGAEVARLSLNATASTQARWLTRWSAMRHCSPGSPWPPRVRSDVERVGMGSALILIQRKTDRATRRTIA
jgi:hypothetical protein